MRARWRPARSCPTTNGEGDWSVTIDPIPVAGHFTVSADCTERRDGDHAPPAGRGGGLRLRRRRSRGHRSRRAVELDHRGARGVDPPDVHRLTGARLADQPRQRDRGRAGPARRHPARTRAGGHPRHRQHPAAVRRHVRAVVGRERLGRVCLRRVARGSRAEHRMAARPRGRSRRSGRDGRRHRGRRCHRCRRGVGDRVLHGRHVHDEGGGDGPLRRPRPSTG